MKNYLKVALKYVFLCLTNKEIKKTSEKQTLHYELNKELVIRQHVIDTTRPSFQVTILFSR